MKKRLLCLILAIILSLSPAFQPDVQAADRPGEEFKGYLVRLADSGGMVQASLKTGKNLEMIREGLCLTEDLQTAQELVDSGIAEFYEPNYILTVQDGPSYTPSQWNLLAVKIEAAWEHVDYEGGFDMQGDGVAVAVIDSGVYRDHPDFNKDNILENYCLADDDPSDEGWEGWHGTFVAGIIAARVNNDLGIDGLTPNVVIMPVSVTNNGQTTTDKVIAAIEYAIEEKADVINISIGGSNYSELLEETCQRAVDAGIIVVAAAGNYLSGVKSPDNYMYPASYDCVVSVSACKQDGGGGGTAINAVFDSSYSYFNNKVTVSAPGTDILSLFTDGGTYTSKGTSFSAPHVSSMAAMAKQRNKALSPAVFETLLEESTDDLGDSGYDIYYGHGFVNIEKLALLLDKSYDIIYNNIDNAFFEEGTLVPESYTLASPDISLPEPFREGDRFMGWYEEEDSSGSPVTEIPSASMGDRTFYAAWESDKLVTGTAEIIVSHGASGDPDSVDPGDTLSLSLNLDKEDQYGGTISWHEGDSLLHSADTYTVEINDVGRTINALYTGPEGWLGTLATDAVKVEKAVLGGILIIEQTSGIKSGDILGLSLESQVNGDFVQSESSDYSLCWLRNGQPVPGETSASYIVKKEDRGQKISVTAQARGEIYKGSLVSNEVEVPAASSGGEIGPGGGGGGGGAPPAPIVLLYTIKAAAGSGGSITPPSSQVEAGGSQTFTIIPDEGFEISNVLVNGESIGPVSSYTFKDVNENSTIEAIFAQKTIQASQDFIDIKDEDWFKESVEFVVGLALFKGTDENTFSPYMSMTRGMFVTVLGRLYEHMNDLTLAKPRELSFDDVPLDSYFAASVKWASDNNIISGYGEGLFKPDQPVSREQIVAILYRFAAYAGLDTRKTSDIRKFPDSEEASPWALEALNWAAGSGILGGRADGSLDPQGLVQRCEVAAILFRSIHR